MFTAQKLVLQEDPHGPRLEQQERDSEGSNPHLKAPSFGTTQMRMPLKGFGAQKAIYRHVPKRPSAFAVAAAAELRSRASTAVVSQVIHPGCQNYSHRVWCLPSCIVVLLLVQSCLLASLSSPLQWTRLLFTAAYTRRTQLSLSVYRPALSLRRNSRRV